MRRKKVDNTIERNIITGMITSNEFLKVTSNIYRSELMKTPFIKTIARWCIDYYDSYEKAPGETIEDIFETHERNDLDEEQGNAIRDFLVSISDEHERGEVFNVKYVLDQTKEYWINNALKNMTLDVKVHLDNGDVDLATEMVESFKALEVSEDSMSDCIDPYTDEEALWKAFQTKPEGMFNFPGALGELLQSQLDRECFVALMGPEKRGKTFWLLEFAELARKARLNVAFFSAGDMSEGQTLRRMAIRSTGRNTDKHFCGMIEIPELDCLENQEDECGLMNRTCGVGIDEDNYYPCTGCLDNIKDRHNFKPTLTYRERPPVKPLDYGDAQEAFKTAKKRMKGRHFKLITKPTDTINTKMIRAYLDSFERNDNFIPDVIIVDYADIMAPEKSNSNGEFRHDQNETWKALRGLSLEYHCLVLVATQTDAASYDKHIIGLGNFSEDKRKYGHVTCMVSLNQSPEEKEDSLMRLAKILVREGMANPARTVTVLQCLAEGRPFLDSYWTPKDND